MRATEIQINCNADATNRFYGNKGALRCLNEEGDVAFLELQYLRGLQRTAYEQLSQIIFKLIVRSCC